MIITQRQHTLSLQFGHQLQRRADRWIFTNSVCCTETEQPALDLLVNTTSRFGSRVRAETLWISTSSCSLLRRLYCCWTLFVIPAKLPESFPLLQLFVTPPPTHTHAAGSLCCYSHPIIRFMTMEKADETKITTIWGASSVTLPPQGQTHKPQCPDQACILNLYYYTGRTLLNYVTKCTIFHILLDFTEDCC